MTGEMGIEVCGTFCSSNSSSSEDITIWRRRVVARFCRGEMSITSGFSRWVFRNSRALVFFLLYLGRGVGDGSTGLICAPVSETLRSFSAVLSSSSKRVIPTPAVGEGDGFLPSFFGGLATCLDSTLIETAGSLGANGRRTDGGPSTDFGVTFFLVVGFFLVAGKEAFGLRGEGSGEMSDIGSSSTVTVTGGETVVLLLAPTPPKPSFTTIL